MSFQSPVFIVLVPIIVVGYYVTPPKFRWIPLLVASYGFYATWRPEFCALLLFSTCVDYFIGRKMASVESVSRRRFLLALSVTVNIGLLVGFKYLAFIAENSTLLLQWLGMEDKPRLFSIAIPIGISYYTFQTLSYTIDVYKCKRAPERHFGIFAVYVSFFPQLLAGPIERSTRFLPQLHSPQAWDYDRFRSALILILLGFCKKLIIADRIAAYTDFVSDNVHNASPEQLALLGPGIMYGFYCDISGYTDIALGIALLFGYRLSENFNRPFAAANIREFWLRWHMSVTAWFRTYVYFGLAKWFGRSGRPVAVVLLFLLIGAWHGAKWGWILFGLAQGAAIVLVTLTRNSRHGARRRLAEFLTRNKVGGRLSGALDRGLYALSVLLTLAFLALSSVLVGTRTVPDAFAVYSSLTRVVAQDFTLSALIVGAPIRRFDFALIGVAILVLEAFQWLQAHRCQNFELPRLPVVYRVCITHALMFAVLIFGWLGSSSFVYFDY